MASSEEKLEVINDKVALPTSTIPLNRSKEPPKNVTHVYTREHHVKGLDSRYRGPFRILSRPTRTTIEIKVGQNKDKSDRTEVRHWGDVKAAHLRDDEVVEAERPKRGRPSKKIEAAANPSVIDPSTSTDQNNNVLAEICNIDFTKPPPKFKPVAGISKAPERTWAATPVELAVINRSIRGI